MYKISEFSKITQLTVKTLHYYDEQGILPPSYRAENGYRFYSEEDFKRAELIQLLRSLQFSISEMKDVLRQYEAPEDLGYILMEKRGMVEAQMAEQRRLLDRIDTYLEPDRQESVLFSHSPMDVIRVAGVTVACIRFRGAFQDVGKHISTLYKEARGRAVGSPFSHYYDLDFHEQADIEICIPIRAPYKAVHSQFKTFDSFQALRSIHTGPYDALNLTYKVMMDYAHEKNLECRLPSREIYLKGPGPVFKGNTAKYRTEILLPL